MNRRVALNGVKWRRVQVLSHACKQYRIKPRLAISTLQELTPTAYEYNCHIGCRQQCCA